MDSAKFSGLHYIRSWADPRIPLQLLILRKEYLVTVFHLIYFMGTNDKLGGSNCLLMRIKQLHDILLKLWQLYNCSRNFQLSWKPNAHHSIPKGRQNDYMLNHFDSVHIIIQLIKQPFQYYPPTYASQAVSSLQVSKPKFCIYFLFLPVHLIHETYLVIWP